MATTSKPAQQDKFSQQMVHYRKDIFAFIEDMWGLTPQPVKPEYKQQWEMVQRCSAETWEQKKKLVGPEWFGERDEETEAWSWYHPDGDIDGPEEFMDAGLISWQQTLILLGVKKAYNGDAPVRLTTRSGHGIGKSAALSWTLIWFLYCFFRSKAGCTAPTSTQLSDVLWNELNIWIKELPEQVQKAFIYQNNHIRMKPDPDSWFARAKTGKKENPEALAGIHADNVLLAADEASGVAEAIFNTVEGSLTSGNTFVFLISNATRTYGYFYDTHKKKAIDWQRFHFSSRNSPLVDPSFWINMREKHTETGREYKIRVQGEFPDEGEMDDSGYIQLFRRSDIDEMADDSLTWPHRTVLGLDPAGKGSDLATWVLRDGIKAKKLRTRSTSNPKQLAAETLSLARIHDVEPEDVVVEGFGPGSDAARQVALLTDGQWDVMVATTGDRPEDFAETHSQFRRKPRERGHDDKDRFLNIRALMYFRARRWCKQGGMIAKDQVLTDQLATIRYKTQQIRDRIKLMPKKRMRKEGFASPDAADAFALTHLVDLSREGQTEDEKQAIREAEQRVENPYSLT